MELETSPRFVDASIIKNTAGHSQSLPHWFRLLTRWRREGVIRLTNEVSKFEGASSKIISRGNKRFRTGRIATSEELTLGSQIKNRRYAMSKARHRATECISQVSTHWETGRERFNNPMCVVRRIQARYWVTDWHFAMPHRESRSHRTTNVGLEELPVECQRENNGVHRLPRDATSLKIPVPKHRETDCSQR